MPSQLRMDPAEVDPTWPAPVPATPPAAAPGPDFPPPAEDNTPRRAARRGLPANAVYALIAAGLALLLLVIWLAGGFERRNDLLTDVPVGTTVNTGPYTFTFTEVTAQRVTNYKKEVTWKLVAVGTGASTDDTTGAPDYGDTGSFVSRDDASKEVQTPKGLTFGDDGVIGRGRFTPGLAPIRFTVNFEYSDRYRPQPTLRFVVFELEKRDTSLLGDGVESWHSTGQGFSYQLPIRVLPPQE